VLALHVGPALSLPPSPFDGAQRAGGPASLSVAMKPPVFLNTVVVDPFVSSSRVITVPVQTFASRLKFTADDGP